MCRPAGGTHSCCLHSDLGTQRHPAHTSYIQRSTTAPSAQEAWVPLSLLAGCWLQWPKPLSAPRGSCEQSCSNRGSCGFCHLRGFSKQAFPSQFAATGFPQRQVSVPGTLSFSKSSAGQLETRGPVTFHYLSIDCLPCAINETPLLNAHYNSVINGDRSKVLWGKALPKQTMERFK